MEENTSKQIKRITLDERVKIETLLKEGYNQSEIANKLGRDRSVICREIRKGLVYQKPNYHTADIEVYRWDVSDRKANKAKENSGAKSKILIDDKLAPFIELKLKEGWSPDVTAGYITKHQEQLGLSVTVSSKCIYNWIEQGLLKFKNIDLLRKVSFKKRKTQKVKNETLQRSNKPSIHERPIAINDRSEFGHWEMDSVIGKKSGGGPTLITLVERITRQGIIIKTEGKTADETVRCLNVLESRLGNDFNFVFKSITMDNGTEFSNFKDIEKSSLINDMDRTKAYFADPYSSYQRGTNENYNGMIRRYIKKGTDLLTVPGDKIKKIQDIINNRPRKILNYESSNEVFQRFIDGLNISINKLSN